MRTDAPRYRACSYGSQRGKHSTGVIRLRCFCFGGRKGSSVRYSGDMLGEGGYIRNGYDYNLQVWVKDYKVLNCGHPERMRTAGPCCPAHTLAGRDVREIAGAEKRG